MNNIFLSGQIVSEPFVNKTGDRQITSMVLSVKRSFGEIRDNFKIYFFGQKAEDASSLVKDQYISLHGRFTAYSYVDNYTNTNKTRYSVNVVDFEVIKLEQLQEEKTNNFYENTDSMYSDFSESDYDVEVKGDNSDLDL